MSKYMHVKTGSIDTREGWIASYAPEELEERGLSAEEAFNEDEGETLIEIDEKKSPVSPRRREMKYHVEYSKPDSILYPKGAWVLRDERGRYEKDFLREKNARKHAEKLNKTLME